MERFFFMLLFWGMGGACASFLEGFDRQMAPLFEEETASLRGFPLWEEESWQEGSKEEKPQSVSPALPEAETIFLKKENTPVLSPLYPPELLTPKRRKPGSKYTADFIQHLQNEHYFHGKTYKQLSKETINPQTGEPLTFGQIDYIMNAIGRPKGSLMEYSKKAFPKPRKPISKELMEKVVDMKKTYSSKKIALILKIDKARVGRILNKYRRLFPNNSAQSEIDDESTPISITQSPALNSA
jgi:hypothetical protein